jgi:hypothetical protein
LHPGSIRATPWSDATVGVLEKVKAHSLQVLAGYGIPLQFCSSEHHRLRGIGTSMLVQCGPRTVRRRGLTLSRGTSEMHHGRACRNTRRKATRQKQKQMSKNTRKETQKCHLIWNAALRGRPRRGGRAKRHRGTRQAASPLPGAAAAILFYLRISACPIFSLSLSLPCLVPPAPSPVWHAGSHASSHDAYGVRRAGHDGCRSRCR